MARSTRESILTAAAELMRHKGYGAVGMKDIAAASGFPIGSLVPPLSRRQGADRTGGADQRGHRLRTAHPDDRRRVRRSRRGHRGRLPSGRRGHGGHRVREHVPGRQRRRRVRRTPSTELRDTSAAVFNGWIDGGTAYFAARGLDEPVAREVTVALMGALEGAFVLARTLRSTEPLLAAGRALGRNIAASRWRSGSAAAVGPG